MIRHVGASRAEWLGRTLGAVLGRLVLHLGVELGAKQNDHTDSQIQTMKPTPAPSEP